MAVKQRTRRAPMAEINVVPYIDVMLVLLVIFMITAPLLATGVKVELPEAAANPIERESKEPLVVSVNAAGEYFLNVGDNNDKPVDENTLVQRVAAVLRNQPGTPVLVRGDKNVNYGRVIRAMTLLQSAGAPSVGLVTESPAQKPSKPAS
ncbi:MAG: protein TolR [Gammaproteobacteria bacterium]|nr:protein TolR [Gammaproteobacteria bacterium]